MRRRRSDEIFRGTGRRILVTSALIAVLPVAFVLRIVGIRFLGVGVEQRIGHLVGEPYYAACLRVNNHYKYRKFVLTYDPSKVANATVIECLPPYYFWVKSKFLRLLFRPLQRHPLCTVDMNKGIRTATDSAEIFRVLTEKCAPSSFIQLPMSLPDTPQGVLREFGVQNRDWYVVVHNREAKTFGELDEMHDYRNGSISNFLPAIEEILNLGGGVIRIGDPSMTALPQRDGLIDFALSSDHWGIRDLNICKNARLFLGSTSGALVLAAVQNVPIVGVNLAPMGAAKIWDYKAIAVPKIYADAHSGSLIKFGEVFQSELANMRSTESFINAGVQLLETTSDEILGATREALGIVPFEVETAVDRELQQAFLSMFNQKNYSYWSSTKIARQFLRKYSFLF